MACAGIGREMTNRPRAATHLPVKHLRAERACLYLSGNDGVATSSLTPESDTYGTPKGIRIPVAALKGLCPRPLDDGGTDLHDCSTAARGGQKPLGYPAILTAARRKPL